MLDRAALLADLGKLVITLEDDVRERGRELPEADRPLQIEYAEARHAGRTASAYEGWRDERLAQVAVAWVLGAVFVRFIEDNELIERPYLSGPGDRRDLAHDQYARYFEKSPSDTDREFLRHVFREVGALPAAAGLFAETNPLWQVGPSGDGAMVLRKFWQTIDPATGDVAHDFTDRDWDTRFLGDSYQDLSECARKTYALLQTPDFVEAFLLDRTLDRPYRSLVSRKSG